MNRIASSSPLYPIKASANNRYLVDQNNRPFLIIGDAPHTLLVNLTDADARSYLSNRGSNGYNTLWVELLAGNYVRGRPDASMLDGTKPFTGTLSGGQYDLTTPNPVYFAHVDNIVNWAATNGIQLLLDTLETADWTSVALANGTTRCRQWGQYLGNRYKNFPNITWITGNDFQTWRTAANDAVVTAVALGVKDNDNNHLQTVELNYDTSEGLDDPNWFPILTLNGVYDYYPTYVETYLAYNKSNFLPIFLEEAHYEYETVGGTGTETGTPRVLRMQEYYSMLSGALGGYSSGNFYTVGFSSGWQGFLNSPGTTQLMYFRNLMTNRAWFNLVPDQAHTVVTAGYGTYDSFGAVGANTYAPAAKTPDGTLAMCYTPVSTTMTVAMTSFAGPVTSRWYDPSAGSFTAISGSPFPATGSHNFPTPGNNSAGDRDWVLVLETQSTGSTNTAPTITNIPDQTTGEDTAVGPVPFTVGDRESPPGNLSLTGASSNPTLVPNGNIVFGGSGSNRTVTVTPASNQNGTATVTVTVSDGSVTASDTFVLTVNPVNDPPAISGIPNQTISVNGTTGPLSFTVTDVDTPATSLTLSANSSNPTLVPVSNITFGGSGSNRTVTVTATNAQTGNATITVSASDGQSSASNSFVVTVTSAASGAKSFTNATSITIPNKGAATPYPSTINVAGMSGNIGNVTLTLKNLSHTWTPDIDVLLVAPAGQKTIVMSDAGAGGANNVTLSFSDAAASALPQTALTSGTFRPANYTDASSGGDNFPSPAPSAPYGATLSAFNGQLANGTWALYVMDDGPGDQGSIAGGWTLTVTTVTSGGSAPTISDIPDQSTAANTPTGAIPFTINDADTPVSSLTLAGNSSNPALVPNANIVFGGSGTNRTVTITPASGQSGTTTISVTVSDGNLTGTDTFVLTVGTVTQTTQTVSFTNAAAITIPSVGSASPYPSIINVPGPGTVSNVTLTLRNLSHSWTRDIDVLLVGPANHGVIVMSDAGSGGANNVTLTFSDAAASALPQAPLTSGTYRPANYTDASAGGDNFPSPAPSGPYGATLSTFAGQPANGTWALYVVDDGSGDQGSIAGGWTLTIVATTATSPSEQPSRITSITSNTQGAIQLTVSGVIGLKYALQASSDFVGWTTLNIQGNQTGTMQFSDTPTTNLFRFYRTVSVP